MKNVAIKFHNEIEELMKTILEYAQFSKTMFLDSIIALETQNPELAASVISRRKELLTWSHEIEEWTMRVIALYNPTGQDIRAISCINRMNESFYRIGRYGKSIAALAEDISEVPFDGKIKNLSHMADLVMKMIDSTILAFEKNDILPIEGIAGLEEEVDNLRHRIFRESIARMEEGASDVSVYIDLVMISRYIERCGDHAVAMAEKVHYMVTGERIEI